MHIPFQSTGTPSFLHSIVTETEGNAILPMLIKTDKRHRQARAAPCLVDIGRRGERGKSQKKKGESESGNSGEIDARYLAAARAVRLKRRCGIYSMAISHRLPIRCLPGTCYQYMSKDSLLWAFSITRHCTAVGGINLLV